MATINAWVFPGSAGDRAYFSDLGHFRTEVGIAWTMATFVRLDSVAPGEDGHIFSVRRPSNNSINHGLRFDDSNDALSYVYGLGTENDAATMAATTWYLAALTYPGTGTAVTCRLISTAGSQIGSSSGTALSAYDDGQTQEVTYGAHYNGTSTSLELRGRLCLPLFVRGTALSQAALEAYASDPLNEGDLIVATYGSQVTWFDDMNTDQGPNGETITLTGGVTLGSGNGPTVTDRSAFGAEPTISAVGKKSLGVVFNNELAVSYSGSDLGADPPLIELTSDPQGVLNLVAQTVRSYSDTSGTFDCVLNGLPAGPLYLKITNQTVGDASYGLHDIVQINVKADPGAGVVATRRSIAGISTVVSVPITTFDAAGEFHLRNAQEVLTYSKPSGSFPTGLSIDSGTGVISGTIDSGAAAGSPYTATVRATDSNGDYAEQTVSWAVTASSVVPTVKLPGSWGSRRGTRESGF